MWWKILQNVEEKFGVKVDMKRGNDVKIGRKVGDDAKLKIKKNSAIRIMDFCKNSPSQ